MQEEEFEIALKVLIVGNGGIGKSSLIQRYCKGIFTKDYKKTIGVDFLEKQLDHDGENVRLMLWDTAGQEEFDAITKAYYKDAHACVLAFSTTDRDSFEAVEKWKKKVEAECGKIPMVLIQNKIDLIDQAVMEPNEAEGLAKRIGVRFYRISVKDNLKVDDVFEYLVTTYLKNKHTATSEPISSKKIGMFQAEDGASSKDDSSHEKKPSSSSNGDFQIQKPNKQRTKGKKSATQKCLLQ
eukprot:Opistho-2@36651